MSKQIKSGSKKKLSVKDIAVSNEKDAAIVRQQNQAAKVEVIETKPDGAIVRQQLDLPSAITTEIAELGLAVLVARLADSAGLAIESLNQVPEVLTGAGLPATIPAKILHQAAQFYRDRVDAILYRCYRPDHNTTTMTIAQAQAVADSPRQSYKPAPAPTNGTSSPTVSAPAKVRQTIFDHPATRVVMAMGKMGLNNMQAATVLGHFGIRSTPASINTFLRAGAVGQRGEPAKLTSDQQKQVQQIAARVIQLV